VYDEIPDEGEVLIAGPIASSAIRSDNGLGIVIVHWKDVQPLTHHNLCVQVEAIGAVDTNPGNNRACFSVFTELPELVFLPWSGIEICLGTRPVIERIVDIGRRCSDDVKLISS
jgi:hypothetical protein